MNNGKICVSVCAGTAEEMIAKIKQAEEFADVIEIRFDCLSKHVFKMDAAVTPAWARILRATKKPVISTYRSMEQGGRQDLSEKQRGTFWYAGMETEFCDVEEDLAPDAFSQLFKHRILSHHDLNGVPKDLEEIFDRLASASRADTVKIAVSAVDAADGVQAWKLLRKAKTVGKNVIPIAMGEAGKWTRILGLAHGAFMTYASLDEGDETAPGQMKAKDLIETYRVKELDLDTKVYGLIGNPVSESLSPYIHNPVFAAQKINAVFIPLLVKNLDEFIRRMVRAKTRKVELNFAGFSVTMPHKQAIIKHLDTIDPTAEKIGAVNTVKIDDGKLTGYNTDAHGFITPLKERFGDLKGARVALFGAGGAARACVYALKQENANVTVFARELQKTNMFAEELGVSVKQITNGHQPQAFDFDIVVNATPLGMKGPFENEFLLTSEQLESVKFVYDLVTSRIDTPIICEAKKAKIPAIGGLEMLIHQGAKQFEIWTGQPAPMETMRDAIFKRIEQK